LFPVILKISAKIKTWAQNQIAREAKKKKKAIANGATIQPPTPDPASTTQSTTTAKKAEEEDHFDFEMPMLPGAPTEGEDMDVSRSYLQWRCNVHNSRYFRKSSR
jgi:hypothetical protein